MDENFRLNATDVAQDYRRLKHCLKKPLARGEGQRSLRVLERYFDNPDIPRFKKQAVSGVIGRLDVWTQQQRLPTKSRGLTDLSSDQIRTFLAAIPSASVRSTCRTALETIYSIIESSVASARGGAAFVNPASDTLLRPKADKTLPPIIIRLGSRAVDTVNQAINDQRLKSLRHFARWAEGQGLDDLMGISPEDLQRYLATFSSSKIGAKVASRLRALFSGLHKAKIISEDLLPYVRPSWALTERRQKAGAPHNQEECPPALDKQGVSRESQCPLPKTQYAGRARSLSVEQIEQIRLLVDQGHSIKSMIEITGISEKTVAKTKGKIETGEPLYKFPPLTQQEKLDLISKKERPVLYDIGDAFMFAAIRMVEKHLKETIESDEMAAIKASPKKPGWMPYFEGLRPWPVSSRFRQGSELVLVSAADTLITYHLRKFGFRASQEVQARVNEEAIVLDFPSNIFNAFHLGLAARETRIKQDNLILKGQKAAPTRAELECMAQNLQRLVA